jgi:hypothetical protein
MTVTAAQVMGLHTRGMQTSWQNTRQETLESAAASRVLTILPSATVNPNRDRIPSRFHDDARGAAREGEYKVGGCYQL